MTDLRIKCPYDPLCKMMPIMGKEQEHKPIHDPQPPSNQVQYYSSHARALLFSQQHKIGKFLEASCIQYQGGGVFICKPLEGYNKTTYVMRKNEQGDFTCSCQHFSKTGTFCSHLGALFEGFKRRLFKNDGSRDASA